MFNHVGPPVEIPELESRTLEQGRFYKLDKVWVPSVTTVIGHQSKAGILEWQKRVGFHEAEKIRMKSSWRGTKYHNHVEKYLRNEDVEKTQKSEGLTNYLFRSARETLNRISDIHAIEAPLFSRNLCIAGRVDCIAKFDFQDLCDVNIGAEDYIKIAETCKFIVIQNIPNFNDVNANQQQRFITLIDIFYEKKISLMISLDSNLENITSSTRLTEPFKRTLSRLFELTSPKDDFFT